MLGEGVESSAQVEARLRDVSSFLERPEPEELGAQQRMLELRGGEASTAGADSTLCFEGLANPESRRGFPNNSLTIPLWSMFSVGEGQSIRQVMQFEC